MNARIRLERLFLRCIMVLIALTISCSCTEKGNYVENGEQSSILESETESSSSIETNSEVSTSETSNADDKDEYTVYQTDEFINPLKGVNIESCEVYIIRDSSLLGIILDYGEDQVVIDDEFLKSFYDEYLKNFCIDDLPDERLALKMTEEQKIIFFDYLESSNVDILPTADDLLYLGQVIYISYVVVIGEKEYSIVFDGAYMVIDGERYSYDNKYESKLRSFYNEVFNEDYKINSICEIEYDYILGNLTESEYEYRKKELVENGLIDSEEDYYEILSGIDDVTDYIVPSS